MNKFLVLIFIFSFNLNFTQNTFKVNYLTNISDKNGLFDFSYNSTLTFNDKESLYVDDYILDFDTINSVIYKNFKSDFFELNYSENPKIIIIDSLDALKWFILDETKDYGNFKCNKACTTFRGRNYIAWFSTEITTISGPYKFHGLPGLIFEITDNENINIKILNLVFELNTEKLSFNKINYDKTIQLEDYIKNKEKAFEELIKKSRANLPRETVFHEVTVNKNSQIERKYEWEE